MKYQHTTVQKQLWKRDGQKYRCIVKSANGTSATSSAAVMNIRTGS